MKIHKSAKTQIYPGGQRFRTLKELTFDDDTGTLTLFTVTGDVVVYLIPVVTTSVTSIASANIRLGVTGLTDAIIADTLSTDLDAREIWISAGPDSEIEPLDSTRSYIITDGNDILLTLSAQVDAGAITFYCFWSPLSSDGILVAA